MIIHDLDIFGSDLRPSKTNPVLIVDADGWTYRTKDKSLSGMFEETVLVTDTGYEILTKSL